MKGCDAYDPLLGLYVHTLIDFIQRTQPKEWSRFENANQMDTVRKFCVAFNNACDMFGLVHVLRHGFKHRGITFRVCYFRPESSLNQTAAAQYAANRVYYKPGRKTKPAPRRRGSEDLIPVSGFCGQARPGSGTEKAPRSAYFRLWIISTSASLS